MFKAKVNEDKEVFKCKKVSTSEPGYKLINQFFVDNSGFGSEGEAALTAGQFLKQVKAGKYYGITGEGQFQVYIGEFERISSQEYKQQNPEIISSKKIKNNTRLTIFKNGDKVLRLHQTDIIQWKGNKIILNNGGWDTLTTRARFNEFLPEGLNVIRRKGETWVIDTRKENIKGEYKFFNGIEL